MKKISRILLLLIAVLMVASCKDKKEEESKLEKTPQVLEILNQTDDGEITEGILEGYKFVETDEVTSKVKIQMENGDVMLIVLSNSKTPITIENFQNLVKEKFYDGVIFHRVVVGFVIQAGGFTSEGMKEPTPNIKGEFQANNVNNTMSHKRGVLSMARATDYNSASSQFFICHQDATGLDGAYASFGKVFAGMDAVDTIANTETSKEKPLVDHKIKSIRFIKVEEAN